MKKYFRSLLAIWLCMSMMLTAACRKNNSKDTGSNGSDKSVNSSFDGNGSEDGLSGIDSNNASSGGTGASGGTAAASGSSGVSQGSKKDTAVHNLGGRTINYVCFWTELKKGESQRANYYWKNKEAIEKKYNCKINFIYKSSEAIDQEVVPSILSGNPVADVFAIPANRLFALVKGNMLYPLSDCPQLDFSESKWIPSAVRASTVNGKVYSMVASNGPYANRVLLYNKDYFQKNGLPDLYELQKKGQLDWNKLREISKSATKGDVKGFAMAYDNMDTCTTFIHANGVAMVSRDAGLGFTSHLNSQAVINALDFWQKMYLVDKSCTEQNGYDYCMNQFIAGKAAIHCCELYRSETITNGADFKIGMALFPSGPDSSLPYMIDQSSSTSYAMPSTVKNPQDIASVWDAFIDADLISWEEYYYDMFYSDEALEALRTYVKLVHEGKYVQDYIEYLGDQYDIGMHAAFYPVGTGEMTPAQAVETAQSKIDAAIRSYSK